jgi:hypothetical protein
MMIFQESIASFARTIVPLFGYVPFGSIFYAMANNTADENKDTKIKTSIIENKNIRAASTYPATMMQHAMMYCAAGFTILHDDDTMDSDDDMLYCDDGFTTLPHDDTMDSDDDMLYCDDGFTILHDDDTMDSDDDMLYCDDGFTTLPHDDTMDSDDDMLYCDDGFTSLPHDDTMDCDHDMMECDHEEDTASSGYIYDTDVEMDEYMMEL